MKPASTKPASRRCESCWTRSAPSRRGPTSSASSAGCTRSASTSASKLYADQDLHDPTRMIAHVDASGLGLPDRDYYLKPEDRFVEARAKYHEHVARMFVLAGSTPEAADAAATSVFELEKRLAEATLDNVASRDPFQQDHKTSFDGLAAHGAGFRLGKLLRRRQAAAHRSQRDPAEVPAGIQSGARKGADRAVAELSGLARPEYLRRLAFRAIRRAGFRLLRQVPQRRHRNEAALEALRRGDRRPARRCPRPRLRGEALPAGSQGAHGRDGQEHSACDARHDRGPRLDEPRHEGQGAGKACHLQRQGGLPGQVEGLRRGQDRSRLVLCRRGRGHALEHQRRAVADRQAGRSKPLVHDAAHLERLLQRVDERDRVSGRHPAAAGVRRHGHRCGQLRRDRRGHRPRSQPWLRRPGREVRRARAG